MYVRETENEYGTPVSEFICETCGGKFTVCPAVEEDKRDNWQNCLAEECDSYDIDRDVSVIVGLGWGTVKREDES